MSKKAVAVKLLTNRALREGAVEFLKEPRMDKRSLASKLLTNPKMRRGPSSFLQQQSKTLTRMRSRTRLPVGSSTISGTVSRFNSYDERCKNPDTRDMLLQQATQRFRRS